MADKVIDGIAFRTSGVPATKATMMAARIGKVAGPAMGAFAEGGSGALAKAMTAFSGGMDPAETASLIVDICELAEAKMPDDDRYEKIIYDATFQGQLGLIPKVLTFVIQSEFADFFSGFQEAGNQAE